MAAAAAPWQGCSSQILARNARIRYSAASPRSPKIRRSSVRPNCPPNLKCRIVCTPPGFVRGGSPHALPVVRFRETEGMAGGQPHAKTRIYPLTIPASSFRRGERRNLAHGTRRRIHVARDDHADMELNQAPPESLAPPSHFFQNLQCVTETEILEEYLPSKGVFICAHAGPVINESSSHSRTAALKRGWRVQACTMRRARWSLTLRCASPYDVQVKGWKMRAGKCLVLMKGEGFRV